MRSTVPSVKHEAQPFPPKISKLMLRVVLCFGTCVGDDTADAVVNKGSRNDQLVIAAGESVSLRPGYTR